MLLSQLFDEHECIWFYLSDGDREDFANEMESLGVVFDPCNCYRSRESIGRIEVLHRNRALRHMSIAISCMGFDTAFKDIPKIDWRRYRAGGECLVTQNPYRIQA